MGKIRRGGFIFVWWLGDHNPKHVHVYSNKNVFLGRVIISTGKPMDAWIPDKTVIRIIHELQKEKRL